MKKFVLLIVVAMLFSMIPFSSAASVETVTTEYVDLGDGFTGVITTTILSNSQTRSTNSIITAQRNIDVLSAGKEIGTFYLFGEFSYTGTSARAVSDDWDASAISGYSYNGNSYCSGASVRGSCTFTGNGISKPISLTLTCDKNGNIS